MKNIVFEMIEFKKIELSINRTHDWTLQNFELLNIGLLEWRVIFNFENKRCIFLE